MELNRFSKKAENKQTNIRRNILSFSSGSNPFHQKRSPTKPEEASKSVELEQVIVDILEEKVATKVIINFKEHLKILEQDRIDLSGGLPKL